MPAVPHLTAEHMTNAAHEMASLSRRFPHLRPAAERMERRAAAMREGATAEELAEAGDSTLRAIVSPKGAA